MAGVLAAGCKTGASESSELLEQGGLSVAPAEQGAYFTNVLPYSGIDYVNSLGDRDLDNIVETTGSGAAWLDYDQDGWMDLYVANMAYKEGVSTGEKPEGRPSDRLYRNVQGKGFVDVTEKAGIQGEDDFSLGVAVADYDNDGNPDIYVSNDGPNKLYHNNGDGTFDEVAKKAGVENPKFSVQATWFDYDKDGLLDLYSGNYLEYDPNYKIYYQPDGFPPPIAYPGQADVLYHNNGDGTFTDVTEAMGVYMPEGRMMGVGAADYDGDGWTDLYVANDGMADYLYHNEGGKSFKEVGYQSGTAFSEGGEETSSMSVDFGDFDNDGRMDLWVSDIHFSALYHNEGGGLFQDVTVASEIAVPSGQYDAWGSSFIDYDNDGDLDIIKINGAVNHLFGHEAQVFANDGDGTFTDVSLSLGSYFKEEYVGRGACFGDYDNDGDIDAFIVNLNDKPILLRNENLDKNNWITVLLKGGKSNRDGVGAKINLTAGGKTLVTEKRSVFGYVSTNDPRLHFGLGKNAVVDQIEVIWPSGAKQVLKNVKAGQILTITEEQAGGDVAHADH